MAKKKSYLRITSWFLFWEGWLFGHYLDWRWAVIWMGAWFIAGKILLAGLRVGIALGQKSKETPGA